jgi:hypothetical protein
MKLKLPDTYTQLESDSLANLLGIKTHAAKTFLRIALENAILMDRKQLDYGPRNISKGGIFGCLLRASDKFERLFHLFESNRKRAVNESIEDSFRGISNYMIIAIMLSNKEWPSE